VTKNNTTFLLKDVKELTYAAFGKITKDVWTKAEEHVEVGEGGSLRDPPPDI
jgi:hypothetical protein